MKKLQLFLILSLLATSGHRLQAAADLVAVVNDRVILGSDFLGKMSPTAYSLRRQHSNNPP